MQKFFSNRKLIIVMIVIIISMGLMAFSVSVRNSEKTPPLVQRVGNDVVGVVDRVVALPANGVKNSFAAVSDLINTYEENAKLKTQLDDLAQTKTRAATLQSENKELKQQLKLDKTLTDYSQVNAAVLTRSPANWQNTLVINKGSLAGIKKNMPVMAGSGLIGRVIEVNNTNSKVELITTDNQSANRFAAEVITDSGTANGIVTGYDQASSELKIGQLNSDAKIKVGDTVQTSGLGGLTPRGLYIGKVTKVKHDDYGLALSLLIKPAVDLDDFTVVTVIERQMAGD
ncbi:rod shape-determining protein MreC [Loigolactobacillus zhaoyuanensis]|uniref:rod shape-determining protein MreC n=1 Tax=Loigolactobacillus zhaoyuanensis TaxID=2486017 RepID=UPI000F735CB0|nr:rod shape-determining protein MreC [Loigolactobacillus zhaoyuanensis]